MMNGKVENGGLDGLEVANKVEARKGSSLYVYYLTCITTLGGFMIGYDIGVVSGSMLLIGDNWKLSNLWKEGIVSATIGAAAIFSLIAGFLTDLIGRKKVVMIASVIFTIGAGVMGAAPDKEVLLIGRLIVGAAIGRFIIIRKFCTSIFASQWYLIKSTSENST